MSSRKSRNAPQSFRAQVFQEYSNQVKLLHSQSPTWEQMLELERSRKALLDCSCTGKCSKRRESIRMKEMQKYMSAQKTKDISCPKRNVVNHLPRVREHPERLPSLIPARKLLQLNDRVVRALNYHSTASDRLMNLAKSKKRHMQSDIKPWKLTSAMRFFQPSDRLLCLASHRKPFKEPRDPYKISSKALLYAATPRIFHLAEPQKKQEELLINPLKQERKGTTQRITELAKPKVREDKIYRRTPFKVPSRALKAKTSPRLLELAEPRM